MNEEEKSLIDEVQEDKEQIEVPLATLDEDTLMQVRINKVTTQLVNTELLLNQANADIERLEKENTHLAFVIREMKIKPSSTKFKALMDKVVDTAKKYKLQSPIIRK